MNLTEQRTDYEIYRAMENEKDLEELRKLQEKEEDQSRSVSSLRRKYFFKGAFHKK